jgi:hypothetical protein
VGHIIHRSLPGRGPFRGLLRLLETPVMSSPNLPLVTAQVNRVSRRLFLQVLMQRLIWCVSSALVVATVWFLLQPLLIEAAAPWLRWVVAGGLVGASVVLAIILAAVTAPSHLASALALDEKFELKERVTTSLTLRPEQVQTPAAQALLDDVHKRVAALDVPAKFPIRLSWIASLVPAAAAVLLLVALFYQPSQSTAKPVPFAERKVPTAEKAELDKAFEKMKPRREINAEERTKADKFPELEAEMNKIASKPRDTREQVRERIKEMNQVEDKNRERQKELGKNQSAKNQLQDINRQAQKEGKDGPGKDMQDAMAKKDFEKAQEEMDKLAKKIRDGELSEKEREQLKDQLANMKKKADELQQKQEEKEKDLEKKIREAKEQGKDADSLERELQDLKQEGMKMKALQDLAKKMGDAKDSLEKGDAKGAAEDLQAAADQLKEMNLNDKELKDLQDQIERLQQAKDACAKCDGDGDGEKEGKDGEGKGGSNKGKENGNGYAEGRGPGMEGPANGPRPKPKEGKTNNFDAKQKSEFDPKGKKIYDGTTWGKNFAPKSGPEIAGEVKQASQEAPEAIEQQRIPRSYRDSAKGYFRNLGGQADKDLKKQPEEKK